MSEYIENNINIFKQFVKSFNAVLKNEQKQIGNFREDGKRKYFKYKDYMGGVILGLITTCILLWLDIRLSIILENINVYRYIVGVIAIGLMVIDRIIIVKLGKILYKMSFGLTLKGVREYLEWLGMKKFLEDYTLLKECDNLEQINLKEEYLVYATVLGISNNILDDLGFGDLEIKRALGNTAYDYEDMST